MTELAEYPHVRALLTSLCELDDETARLPMDVVLNMHRLHLRAPLLAALHLSETLPQEDPIAVLNERYPGAQPRRSFYDGETVQVKAMSDYYIALAAHNSVGFDDERVEEVSKTLQLGDLCYPAFILYLMGFPEDSRHKGLQLLELLLAAHPSVSLMLSELGAEELARVLGTAPEKDELAAGPTA
jgi:hypothetical protein